MCIGILDYEINSNESHTSHNESKMDKSEIKIWTKQATKLLIENRADLENELNGNKKNFKIWEKISDQLKESGIAITGPNCNTKFRNLMATFKDNLHRANKSGESAINWEYYGIMKQYFGKKDSVAPKKNTLIESSLMPVKKDSVAPKRNTLLQSSVMPLNTDVEVNSDEEQIMPQKKKKKNFQEVLLEEMKEDRKARHAFQSKLENFMEKLIQIETAKLEKS